MQSGTIVKSSSNIQCRKIRERVPTRLEYGFFSSGNIKNHFGNVFSNIFLGKSLSAENIHESEGGSL